MNADKGKILLEVVNDTFDFDLGLLKIDQEAEFEAAGFEVVQALSQVLIRQRIATLQFNDDRALNKNIGEVVTDDPPLVLNGQWRLTLRSNAPKFKLIRQRALVNFLQKPGPEVIADLEGRANDPFRQRV